MLEINQIPGRHLRQLVELIGESAVCRELNIHPKIRPCLKLQVAA
jgi:hypothetical protein